MALTLRSNGTNGGIVSAQWWNDYYNLLTGVMADQTVTLKTNVNITAISGPPGAPTLALAAGTALGVGTYQYVISFIDVGGHETLAGTSASISTTTNNQAVALSAIPLGGNGIAKRNIYRTTVGGSTYGFVATIADNTTQTYTDTTPDGSLGGNPLAHPTAGGLTIRDAGFVTHALVYTDGAVWFDTGKISSDSNGSLTAAQFEISGGPNGTSGRIVFDATNHINVYWAPLSGANAIGHIFVSWSGSAQVNNFSVGGQYAGALAYIDINGALYLPNSAIIYGQSSAKIEVGTSSLGDIHLVPNTNNWVYFDTSGGGAHVDTNGNFGGPVGGGIPTTRNGTALSVPIFTGTNTPSNPPTGSIWIKA